MQQHELTKRQSEIYAFIRDRITRNQFSPTVRDIGAHFGIRSPNGVMVHLKALEKKGYITRDAKLSRGIRLTETPCCPHCGKSATEPVEAQS